MDKIKKFESLKLGMFIHFGLYSILNKGEWYMNNEKIPPSEYEKLISKFVVEPDWADKLVSTAKLLGFKYITITTRHHEGFSLFDTCGLSDYDVMHSPTGRDLVKEFVTACNKYDVKPCFYLTMIDWHHPDFNVNMDRYFKYLQSSLKLLCANYGDITTFWFDGTWFSNSIDWKLNDLYSIVRKYQPNAVIVDNAGLDNLGGITNELIDCITFERSKPEKSKTLKGKYYAQEMCQTLNNHWGVCDFDDNYKSAEMLLSDFDCCKKYNANFLLNTGLEQNGYIPKKELSILQEFSKLIKNKKLI